jgi:hypothetical protein
MDEGAIMAISAGRATDPWDIVVYEAEMFFGLCRVMSGPPSRDGDEVVANAIVESACLHARIMADILLSKSSGRGDDIKLDGLVPGFRSSSIDKLRSVYGDAKTPGMPCWVLNKMIAHPTLKRSTSYDYTGVIRALHPCIKSVWNEVLSYDPALLTRARPSHGGVQLTLSAKTSS